MAGRLHVYYTESTIKKLWESADELGISQNDLAFSHLSEAAVKELLIPMLRQLKEGKSDLTVTLSAEDFKEKFSNIRPIKMKGFYKGKEVTEEALEKGTTNQQVEQVAHD